MASSEGIVAVLEFVVRAHGHFADNAIIFYFDRRVKVLYKINHNLHKIAK